MSDGDGYFMPVGTTPVYDGKSIQQLVADLSAADPSRAMIFEGLGTYAESLSQMGRAIGRGATGTDAEFLANAMAAAQGMAPLANKPNLSEAESFLLTNISFRLIQVFDQAKVAESHPLRIQLEGVLADSFRQRTCD